MSTAPELVAYRDMRRARRARRLGEQESQFDRFFRAYLTVFVTVLVAGYLAQLLRQSPTTASQLATVRAEGPGVLGLVLVAGLVVGARSGTHGGPLVVDPGDVAHVLSAPVSRRPVLLPLAARKLTSWTSAGLAVGVVAGFLASLRLPGGLAEWMLCGAAFGGCAAVASVGVALLVSGRRVDRRVVAAGSAVCLAGSVWCAAAGSAASPFAFLAEVALFPLRQVPSSFVLVPIALAVAAAALAGVDRISIEAAERRASLTARIKFGLASRDFRSVLLVSRVLAQERPRRRPWIALARGHGRRLAVWKRDVSGVLRWPGVRLLRVAILGVLLGVSARVVWDGVVWLIVPGGLALWLIGVDAADGVAAEAEHRTRARGLPVAGQVLVAEHGVLSGVVVLVACLVGTAGTAVGGWDPQMAVVGAIAVVPAVLAGLAAGAVTNLRMPKPFGGIVLAAPDILGPVTLLVDLVPPAIAMCALLPVWEAGVAARQGLAAPAGALAWLALPVVLAVGGGTWATVLGSR